VLKVLVNANPESVAIPNQLGRLPIHYLCEDLNARDAIELLINIDPRITTMKCKENKTPIDIALENMFTIDGKLKSLMIKQDTLRMMLRKTDKSRLTEQQISLLKDLNFSVRSTALLLSKRANESGTYFAERCDYFALGIPGIWRNIVMYL
jgi:hypothetical protein